jgi:hypothetical protein
MLLCGLQIDKKSRLRTCRKKKRQQLPACAIHSLKLCRRWPFPLGVDPLRLTSLLRAGIICKRRSHYGWVALLAPWNTKPVRHPSLHWHHSCRHTGMLLFTCSAVPVWLECSGVDSHVSRRVGLAQHIPGEQCLTPVG